MSGAKIAISRLPLILYGQIQMGLLLWQLFSHAQCHLPDLVFLHTEQLFETEGFTRTISEPRTI